MRILLLLAMALPAYGQRTLTLRQALETAEKLSPDVQLARLRVLEAEANTGVARSAYQPQLEANISGTYQTVDLQGMGVLIPGYIGRIGPFRTFNAKPVLTQTVIDLSLVSSIRMAKERERGLAFDVQTTRDATLLAVLQIYLQIQQAESRMSAAQARLQTSQAVRKQASDFEQSGTANKLDVMRADQFVHSEQAAVIQAQRDRDVLKVNLARVIGIDPGETVTFEPPTLAVRPAPEGALQMAMQQRPELKSVESRTAQASLDEQRAGRQRYPKLGFAGDFGVSGAGPDRSVSVYTVGAQLSIPIWTGGRVGSEVAAARQRVEQGKIERRAVELRIAEEVRQAELEMAAAIETLKSAEGAMSAAKESLELARLRFGAGLTTNLDTIQAQGILAQAEDFAIRTRYDYYLARARHARATGNIYGFE